jgi:hypothetical protein
MYFALASLALAAPKPPPTPFPQDCTTYNASSVTPTWFTDCTDASPCFSIIVRLPSSVRASLFPLWLLTHHSLGHPPASQVPKEKEYNVGNTSFGETPSGGVKWCIDHLQGYVYNKVIDPAGAMYYEVDDILYKPPAPQCRFLVGADVDPSSGKTTYRARTFLQSGLECDMKYKGVPAPGVMLYELTVSPSPAPHSAAA